MAGGTVFQVKEKLVGLGQCCNWATETPGLSQPNNIDEAKKIEKSFHILLYSQSVTFVSAIIFLVIFTILNL